ncbi:hypothetical protein AGMMS49525_10350 [Bacteroidia bacterium]|nr:hypothetical protein AGMMS49525_10350 [Bacteroidia bacterium]
MNNSIIQQLFAWFAFAFGSIGAYFSPTQDMIVLVIILYFVDFATGYAAYIKTTGKLGFVSKRLRWSLVKLLVYLAIIVCVYVIYDRLEVDKYIEFQKVSAIIMWAYVYIEGLSIVENAQKISPEDKFLKFLHYLLSVKVLAVIPFISNMLKEYEENNNNKQ